VTSRLVLFGPPGAGKGTQAAALSTSLSVPHISTGDIFRGAVASGTALGLEAKSYLDKGELVPDAVVIGMIRDRLTQSDTQQGWLLDGFPRTVTQAQALDELLQDIGQSLEGVLNLQVPNATLVERLLSRGRQDDSEEVIRRRLEVYQVQTEPLIEFYRSRDRLVDINGSLSVEAVTAAIHQALDNLNKNLVS
jgi:adenylate kinase